jgi:hypothetical protein
MMEIFGIEVDNDFKIRSTDLIYLIYKCIFIHCFCFIIGFQYYHEFHELPFSEIMSILENDIDISRKINELYIFLNELKNK